MKKLTVLLLVTLSWLQYSLWLGKNGLNDFIYIKKNLMCQQQRNAVLKIRNEQLCAKINNLYHSVKNPEERQLSPTEITPVQKTDNSITVKKSIDA
ncbi:Cell division protein FtsB [Candidatus Erwinia haradaeae]|uniref:Cell division protein FtsB, partial n=1 Tax=Candidatus Erwinia haradaeae TaxID=1922217 RepID=A0A451DDN5_9GAMM|nr:septum formation initiator family protein [Candidatus Erwinia haradaeae]VFP84537.1 Cell division protein FtsB [Candidatus Erwinia haradaeae]